MRNTFQILIVVVAVFGLGLGLAFGAGAFYGRRSVPAPASPSAPAAGALPGGAAAGGLAGLRAGGGAPGGAGAMAPTTGVVEQIDGDTVTVRTQNGGTVAVKMQDDTQVRQLAPATAADIQPGLTVVVVGQPGLDGKLTARSIQITGRAPPGGQAPTGGQGGEPGSRPARTPTP